MVLSRADYEKASLLSPTRVNTDYSTASSVQASTVTVTTNLEPAVKTYWWRWFILATYSLVSVSVNLVWISAAPIANTITCYYDVSVFWVNGLSEVYMLTYIFALFPVVWLLDKYGLRLSMVMGASLNAAGAALKVAGTGTQRKKEAICVLLVFVCGFSGPQYFWVTMFGQTLASLSDVFVWTAGPLLSEVWFPSRERATATAVGTAISVQVRMII